MGPEARGSDLRVSFAMELIMCHKYDAYTCSDTLRYVHICSLYINMFMFFRFRFSIGGSWLLLEPLQLKSSRCDLRAVARPCLA